MPCRCEIDTAGISGHICKRIQVCTFINTGLLKRHSPTVQPQPAWRVKANTYFLHDNSGQLLVIFVEQSCSPYTNPQPCLENTRCSDLNDTLHLTG